jgi:2-C-methyl-D-erythritol 2,4-cyclodiphosphate synthase
VPARTGKRLVSYRIGIGYDAHRFAPGRKLVLGGVEIPHSVGLDGHSDADVLCHAIADAILGALAEGDLGRHFPPESAEWKGASSLVLLSKVMDVARRRGARVVNVDSTLLLEAPRIARFADAMREALGRVLNVPSDAVSIKATTNEGLDAVGRGQGAAAHAIVLLDLR